MKVRAVLVLAIVPVGVALAGGPPEFEVTRSTIDGGGVMRSEGGEFECSGTVGQPDVGQLAGGEFELTGGFWFGLAPADCEEDGDVDLFDYDLFEPCLVGPDGAVSQSCRCFDTNRDGTIDMLDTAIVQQGFTG
ncbi:MAG: dockerin type I domain-containing protein [Phycisphaerae bacterium]|jgi:hypothetical protein